MTTEGPGPDLGALLSQLGQVQQNLQAAQQSAPSQAIEGVAGGGAVRISATGGLDVQSVTIDAAVVAQANALQSQALGGVGLGGGLEGLLGS